MGLRHTTMGGAMTKWMQRIQKRIDTNAKFFLWLGCIVSMARIKLKAICCKSKKQEEPKQPKDYVMPPRHIWDWEKHDKKNIHSCK